MKAWWAGLSSRDRLTLGVGAYVAGVILVWFGVVRPLSADNAELRARVAVEYHDYAWMQRAAHEVEQLRASTGGESANPKTDGNAKGGLLAQVNASLSSANLATNLKNMRPDGDGKVYLVLKNCTYMTLSKWLASLTGEGIDVSEAQISRRGPGEVDARLSLIRGGN